MSLDARSDPGPASEIGLEPTDTGHWDASAGGSGVDAMMDAGLAMAIDGGGVLGDGALLGDGGGGQPGRHESTSDLGVMDAESLASMLRDNPLLGICGTPDTDPDGETIQDAPMLPGIGGDVSGVGAGIWKQDGLCWSDFAASDPLWGPLAAMTVANPKNNDDSAVHASGSAV